MGKLDIGSAISGGLGITGSIIGNLGQKKREKRSMENQKELNRHGKQMALEMWNETNYEAQMEHMKKAGVNPALMYGQGGGGGTTANSGSGGNAPAPQQMDVRSGLDAALAQSTIRLQDSQAKKNEAETTSVGETGKGIWLDNLIKKYGMTGDPDTYNIEKHSKYGSEAVAPNSQVAKKMRAEAETTEEQLKNAKKQNNIADAETIVKQFEAEMAKEGISSNSPYYIKLMTDILRKSGILNWLRK